MGLSPCGMDTGSITVIHSCLICVVPVDLCVQDLRRALTCVSVSVLFCSAALRSNSELN